MTGQIGTDMNHDAVTEVRRPDTFTGDWAEAESAALDAQAPLFVPITPFTDDRGWSLMNLLTGAMTERGQINFSMQYPQVVKAWHRHDHQTDFWCCLTGHLKTGVFRPTDGVAWVHVMGEKRPGVLVIPTPLWHGAACVGPTPAGLLYYVTNQYNPAQPDEHRRAWDSVRGFPWEVQHG
ncbi:MAG: hypothetical protein AAF432_06480 [Planctomycetota bacterium]